MLTQKPMLQEQQLYIYNTLTREKEICVPAEENSIKIYSCGPTVYSDPHVGNLRYFVFCGLLGDVCRHILRYETTHVMNITDVGHLTDDADAGEDKLEKGSKREGVSVREVAKKYEESFKKYLEQLHIHFDAHPRATDYIREQIDIVRILTEKGYTYSISDDGIYMDTSRVPDYGKLLGPQYKKHIAGLQAGNRIDATGKKNPTDFALWKFSPRDQQRQMEWVYEGARAGLLIDQANRVTLSSEEDATRGFPGWHIECSAMSRALLGDTFDIHTGGVDHIAVHHSDEIAQSEHSFCTHTPWVRYRLHVQFLNIHGEKVAKSSGDSLSLPALEQAGYQPEDLRYFFFTGQYRNFLEFTYESLQAAKATRNNMIKKMYQYLVGQGETRESVQQKYYLGENASFPLSDTQQKKDLLYSFFQPLCDDFDTPKLLAHIQKSITSLSEEILHIVFFLDATILHFGLVEGILATYDLSGKDQNIAVPEHIMTLAQERVTAKQAKDFVRADELRNELAVQGWDITDTPAGFSLTWKGISES